MSINKHKDFARKDTLIVQISTNEMVRVQAHGDTAWLVAPARTLSDRVRIPTAEVREVPIEDLRLPTHEEILDGNDAIILRNNQLEPILGVGDGNAVTLSGEHLKLADFKHCQFAWATDKIYDTDDEKDGDAQSAYDRAQRDVEDVADAAGQAISETAVVAIKRFAKSSKYPMTTTHSSIALVLANTMRPIVEMVVPMTPRKKLKEGETPDTARLEMMAYAAASMVLLFNENEADGIAEMVVNLLQSKINGDEEQEPCDDPECEGCRARREQENDAETSTIH